MPTFFRLVSKFTLGVAISCTGERFELGDDDPPPIAPPALLARCPDTVTGSRSVENDDAMISVLTGRWYRCRGVADGILFLDAIEFTQDRKWFALEDDGTGHLVRSRDPSRYGTYGIDAPVILNISYANGGQQLLTVILDEEKRAMVALRSTLFRVDVAYVHE